MFRIDYNHNDYNKVLLAFADAMKVKVKKETVILPSNFGEGFFKSIRLSNGLDCLVSNYTLHSDLYLQRISSAEEFYILRFDEVSISDTLMVKIDKDYIWETKQDRASVLLTSSLFDFATSATKGTVTRSINVLITRDWLSKYLDINSLDEILNKYLNLKTDSYNFAPFDIEYRAWFNEIMEVTDSAMKRSIIENRIMLMVEKFLNNLYANFHPANASVANLLPHHEVKRLMEVESYLVKDFSTPPPPLSFLSRVAAMSTTTLKNKFKKLYGINVYEYFQKCRMQKAKALLLSHKYTIKEIGSQLGYSNLSNFATAFKKEFDKLPSQLILQH